MNPARVARPPFYVLLDSSLCAAYAKRLLELRGYVGVKRGRAVYTNAPEIVAYEIVEEAKGCR